MWNKVGYVVFQKGVREPNAQRRINTTYRKKGKGKKVKVTV